MRTHWHILNIRLAGFLVIFSIIPSARLSHEQTNICPETSSAHADSFCTSPSCTLWWCCCSRVRTCTLPLWSRCLSERIYKLRPEHNFLMRIHFLADLPRWSHFCRSCQAQKNEAELQGTLKPAYRGRHIVFWPKQNCYSLTWLSNFY